MNEVPQTIEQQPGVETLNGAENFVPTTVVEEGENNLPTNNLETGKNNTTVAAEVVHKSDHVVTIPNSGYPYIENINDLKDLTAGGLAAALTAQKANKVNIEDLPIAV